MSISAISPKQLQDRIPAAPLISEGIDAMTQSSEVQNNHQEARQELRDAGSCLAMGAGVGAVGTISAVLIGATCPICVIMAPALIGMGLVKGYAARKKLKSGSDSRTSPPSHHAPWELR